MVDCSSFQAMNEWEVFLGTIFDNFLSKTCRYWVFLDPVDSTKMEMLQRHLNIHMMAQSRVSDGPVRESTQEFNSGVKAQMWNPF